ncbi:portal protein [Acinetobacter phage vB_AbaS_Silvergun]
MTPEQHAAKIRELEAPMAAAYLAEVRAVESEASVADVERLLREGDSEGLVAYLSLGAMAGFLELFRAAFIQGANNEALGRFRLDSNTWAVINLLMGANQEIQSTSDMDLRKSVAAVMGNGNTTRNQALDLIGVRSPLTGRRSGGVVGLPIQMTEWVQSARQQLLSGDRTAMMAYLKRRLRDTSFDKFIIPGERLTVEQVNTIARAYSSKLLQSYAKQFAQTYAGQAYESGRNQAISQAIDTGKVDREEVKKKWRTMRDERVRHSHVKLDRVTIPYDEPFLSVLGNLMMYPHDRSLGANEDDLMNCRCSLEYVINKRF